MDVSGYARALDPASAASMQVSVLTRQKSELTGALLGLLFGSVGAHRFYRGQVGSAIAYIAVSGLLAVLVAVLTPLTWSVAVIGVVPWAGWTVLLATAEAGALGLALWAVWIAWGAWVLVDAALTPHAILKQNVEMARTAYRKRRED